MNPNRRAFGRKYRRDYITRSWQRATGWERGIGLLSNAVTALLSAGAWAILFHRGAPLRQTLAAAFLGLLGGFGVLMVWALLTTGAEQAWEREKNPMESPDSRELSPFIERTPPESEGQPFRMTFVTWGRAWTEKERLIKTGSFHPTLVRITDPRRAHLREEDLPARVRLGWHYWRRRGSVVVLRYLANGFFIDERKARPGWLVTVELEGHDPQAPWAK